MALPPDARLATAYLTRYNRLRTRTAVAVGLLWDRYAGLDDAAAVRFSEAATGTVQAAQANTTALVNAYLSATAVLVADATLELDDTPPTPRGVDPEDVYQRGIVTARAMVSEGKPYLEALATGRARSVNSAATDVLLAQRDVMTRAVDGTRIVGYRRVLTGESCALCASASTQRYTRANLMPIHGHCDCGIAPIIGDRDPGQIINKPLLDDLKAASKATGDPDYWRNRKLVVDEDGTVRLPDAQIRQHGELGPVLTDADHEFTREADLVA